MTDAADTPSQDAAHPVPNRPTGPARVLQVIVIILLAAPLIILGHWLAAQPVTRTVPAAPVATAAVAEADADLPVYPGAELYFHEPAAGALEAATRRYRCAVDMTGVVEYYEREMPRRGWELLRDASAAYSREYAREGPGAVMVFRRGRRTCLIAVSRGVVDGGAMVTLVTGIVPADSAAGG